MKRSTHLARLLLALVVATAALAPVAERRPTAPDVPSAIEVPDGHKVFLVGHAVGVQIYACAAGGWTFVAPRADLYGDNGKLVTTHFGGPTWQARDGSQVVGRRVDGMTVDTTSIPWLLLSAASTAAGHDGDRLVRTSYVQRTATTGGLAPAPADCNGATEGKLAEVPYTADYHFWRATGRR